MNSLMVYLTEITNNHLFIEAVNCFNREIVEITFWREIEIQISSTLLKSAISN